MKTLETDAEIHADGSIRVLSPLPEWWTPGRQHLRLELLAAPHTKRTATADMLAARKAALEEVRRLNPYRDIADPVAWQREVRADVALPGRD